MKSVRPIILLLVVGAIVSFATRLYFNRFAAEAQVRSFQQYRVIRFDANASQIHIADQMNHLAEMGYRYRDLREGLIIMEFTGR